MNRKEYSNETLKNIDASQVSVKNLREVLKTKLTDQQRKEFSVKLKNEEANLADLKTQKIKTKQKEHGLAS
jgi:hypothetical protein